MRAQGLRLVAHIEKRAAVGGKDDVGGRVLDALIDDLAARDRAHENAEFPVAAEVDSEGDAGVVRANCPGAELVLLGMAGGERADVEHDLLCAPSRLLAPHDQRILRALSETALVDMAVDSRRYAGVLLRRARLQFRGKFVDQRLDRLETRIGVVVLRVKIGNDPRIAAIAQPIIVVDALAAEGLECRARHRGNRRRGRGYVGRSRRE